MPIKLNTASGGGVILTGANTATDKTITVPADDGTMIYANSSGNVGIGTTSPGFKLEVVGGTNNGIHIKDAASATVYGGLFTQSASLGLYARSNHALTFGTNDTERARIDSSGQVLIGTSSALSSSKLQIYNSAGTTQYAEQLFNEYTSGTAYFIEFLTRVGSTNTARGNILYNGTQVVYNTSSDYRLKTNVKPLANAILTVQSLKPCSYVWKENNIAGEGFIAHELQEVIPQAVTGEKDAVNADGSISPQGVDYSKIVVHLVAAIQEQQQMIETLQAKVAALEAK